MQDMATLDVAEHQPYIHRLTRLGAAAQLEDRSLVFVEAISRVLWDGTVRGWNEGDHLARAAAAAGFDLPAMDAAVTADPDRYEAVIADNEKAHAASGHWGVPTFVFENEPFFGQDRIDLLIWRMQGKGLTRRA
jgi:2-hydroxychromene-2-carboxylate isomerase